MTGRTTHVPVYLVHWGAPQWCASAVASIQSSHGVAVEVTIVDNGPFESAPLADALPEDVRVLPQGFNRGFPGGVNVALDDWKTRYPDVDLCLIGSHDLHVEPDTLLQLVETMRVAPDCGIMAPALTGPHRAAGGLWNGRHSYQVSPHYDDGELVRRDWASGTCLLLRRACVDDIGPFDEELGTYVEDVDYGLRANDAGWRVLVLKSARAHGLGSAGQNSVALITANTILLGAKRSGWRGATESSILMLAWATRSTLAALFPWRTRERRTLSWRYGAQRYAGLWEVLTSGRLRSAIRAHGRSASR